MSDMARQKSNGPSPRLSVRLLDPEQMEYLELEANREDKTISELVREFLAKAISYHKRSRRR